MGRFAVVESVVIGAAPADAWRAIADGRVRASWWSYLDLDARPGAAFEERWADASGKPMRTYGEVLEVLDGRRLLLCWQDEGWSAPTEVTITVEAEGHGSRVTIAHTGWERLPGGSALAGEHRSGWRMHLDNLRRHLETGSPRA